VIASAVPRDEAPQAPAALRRRSSSSTASVVVRWLCRLVLALLGVRRTTAGERPDGAALLLSNHLSWMDIVVLLADAEVTFVAKREVAAWPIIGPLAVALGVVFVDRARKRDLLRSLPELERVLGEGRQVVLFPEGTTSNGRQLFPFKSALVEAAVRAGVPVIPVALRATASGDATPLCWIDDETLLHNLPRVRACRDACVHVQWLAPIMATTGRKPVTARARAEIGWHVRTGAVISLPSGERSHRWRRAMAAGLAKVVGGLCGVLVLGGAMFYAQASAYDFATAVPFRGTAWYNPYEYDPQRDGVRLWWRANLHTHSRAWRGVTAGKQSKSAVVDHYRRLGTQVVATSNYHESPERRERGTLPVYEHGWNVAKSHRLAIGATSVLWFDFPFWSSVHHEQYLIDRLHEHADLVAIAHPGLRHGHTTGSLAQLAGYDLLEVLNHFQAPAERSWDTALSAGRPVWLLASDDSHDIGGAGETGGNFTRILAPDTSRRAIVQALREGRAYGIRARDHAGTLHLEHLTMHGDTLRLRVSGRVAAVRIVGQGGRTVVRWARATNGQGSAAHRWRDTTVVLLAVARPSDGYLRVVADGEHESLFSNPVVRWDGHALPSGLATINRPRTVIQQTAWRMAFVWLVIWLAASARYPRVNRISQGRPALAAR
jgi:1-acyl-sn-glycerol-3-phosphate acyltransferase